MRSFLTKDDDCKPILQEIQKPNLKDAIMSQLEYVQSPTHFSHFDMLDTLGARLSIQRGRTIQTWRIPHFSNSFVFEI